MIDVQALLKHENFDFGIIAATGLVVAAREIKFLLLRPSHGLSEEMRRSLTAKFDAIVMPKMDALRAER